jgi:methyl-accepting chemotaxis protein
MKTAFGKSVGKKLTGLILLALLGVIMIVLTSFSFFGKIAEIGTVAKAGYIYEVIFYQARADLNQFVMTGQREAFEKLNANLDQLIQLDGAIGELHRYLEQGLSVKAAVASYNKNFGGSLANEQSAKLLKTLKGDPLREKLVQVTDKANASTRKWRDLVTQYAQAKEDRQKQALIAQIESVQAPELVREFHSVLADVAGHLSSFVKRLFLLLCLVVFLLLAAAAYFITKSITVPLRQTVDFAKAMSGGDFRQELAIKNEDEVGQMADALNTMTRSLRKMVGGVIDGIKTMNASSTELSTISAVLSQGAQEAASKSSNVQSAAEKMSGSMHSIASAMEESATNANMVAASAEEMSSTIGEIAQNAEKARGISGEAAGQASIASTRMNELGRAAQSIGKVVEAITDISEQVNLLALNATIEAARAGEAGKGFAVVANEIKELAKQTASATQDIRVQIENIQNTTSATVSQMGAITKVINQVNDLVSNIASAVEQQSAATREIAANIGQTSTGIQEVNENVSQSSDLANVISKEMVNVEQTAGEISNSSSQVDLSARNLSKLSEQLKGMVDQFFTV